MVFLAASHDGPEVIMALAHLSLVGNLEIEADASAARNPGGSFFRHVGLSIPMGDGGNHCAQRPKHSDAFSAVPHVGPASKVDPDETPFVVGFPVGSGDRNNRLLSHLHVSAGAPVQDDGCHARYAANEAANCAYHSRPVPNVHSSLPLRGHQTTTSAILQAKQKKAG